MNIPLLLLPGLMNDERVWTPVLAAFGERTVAISPSHLDVGVEALAAAALATLPPGPFAVAGFSLGGYVAQAVCALAGERVAGLALLDTGARAESEEGRQVRQRMIDAVRAGASGAGTRAGTGAGFDTLAAAFLPRVVHPAHMGDTALTQLLIDMARQVGGEGFVRQQRTAMSRPDRRDLLRTLDVPALVLCGRQDLTTPLASSEEMATLLPDAELVVVEESGHMATLEQPEAVRAALARWIARVDAKAGGARVV